MYNPWNAHNHGHAHTHAHHGHTHATSTPNSVNSVSLPGSTGANPASRIDLDSSPPQQPSQSSYQMSQMRWLPSVITRSHNHNSSLPTISSNLRLQHPHPHAHTRQQHAHAQHTQGPVMVESRAPPPPGPGSLVNASQVQQGVPVESVESEESSERSESPGETTSGTGTRAVSGADGIGEAEYTGSSGHVDRNGLGEGGEEDIDDGDGMGENDADKAPGTGEIPGPGTLNLTTRKHGKRLTTKEEVSLFEICNRHAAEFGRRSNLCKWWMTVTMEFTHGQKHPYSWHSVRRKVELVTKQRMKFLEEQREKGTSEADDLSNPRWRSVVDAWIPTWQRWEEAEARRIEKRDSRRPRKRKWSITTPSSATVITDGVWDLPNSSGTVNDGMRAPPSSSGSSPVVNSTPQHHNQRHNHQPTTATPVRLPPGFDTLFSSTQTPTSTSTPYNPHTQHRAHHRPSAQNTPTTPNPASSDSTMMAAVLETLGKLNKHLDSTSQNSAPLPPPSQQNSEHPSSQSNGQDSGGGGGGWGGGGDGPQNTLSAAAMNKLKEDLKREMLGDLRSEWDKERAVLEEKLDSVQRTQEMILEMLRQEPT